MRRAPAWAQTGPTRFANRHRQCEQRVTAKQEDRQDGYGSEVQIGKEEDRQEDREARGRQEDQEGDREEERRSSQDDCGARFEEEDRPPGQEGRILGAQARRAAAPCREDPREKGRPGKSPQRQAGRRVEIRCRREARSGGSEAGSGCREAGSGRIEARSGRIEARARRTEAGQRRIERGVGRPPSGSGRIDARGQSRFGRSFRVAQRLEACSLPVVGFHVVIDGRLGCTRRLSSVLVVR